MNLSAGHGRTEFGLRGRIGRVRRAAPFIALAIGLIVACGTTAQAQVTLRVKAATGTNLAASASWTGGVAPISTTGAQWASTSLGGALMLDTAQTWGLMDVQGATSNITVSGSQLTLASGNLAGTSSVGFNLPAAAGVNVTFDNNLVIGGGQLWRVYTGRTLTVNGVVGTTIPTNSTTYTVIAQGGGTIVLTGANTFLNNTPNSWMRIDGGTTVRVNAMANGGVASPLGQGSATAAQLRLNGGTIDYVGTGHSTNRLFALTNNSTIAANGSGALNYTATGTITYTTTANVASDGRILTLGGTSTADNTFRPCLVDGTSASGLTKSGAGLWIVSGSNTFTGTTTVSGGVLVATSTAALPGWDAASRWSVASGAAIGVGNAFTDANIATLLGTGNFASGAALGFSTAAGNRTYGAAIADTGAGPLGLVKSQANTLTLSASSTYTGDTTIYGGVLELASTGRLYDAGPNDTAVITVKTSGTLRVPNYSFAGMGQLADSAGRRVLDGGVIEVTGSTSSGQNFTANATTGGTFRFTQAGQTLTLTGNETSNIAVNGPLTYDTVGSIVVSEVMEGAGSVAKTGAGTLTLSASNGYTGGTTISAGTVALVDAGSIESTSGVNLSASGAAFDIAGASGSRTIGSLSGSAGTIVVLGGNTLTAGGVANTTFAGGITGSGGLMKAGAGALTLSGSNGYTGATTISGGTLALSGAGSIGSSSAVGLSASGVTLDISAASGNRAVAELSGVAGSTVRLGGNTLTGSFAASGTFDGVISGSGGFTKSGAGTLTLGGVSTYGGATVVESGTIRLGFANALSGSSAITLGSAGSMGTLDVGNHSLAISSLTFAGLGGTLPDAAGTVTLQNLVTGTAGITVSSGSSNEFHPDVTLSSTTVIDVSPGASLLLHATLSGTAPLTKSGVGRLDIFGNNEAYTGAIALTGGTTRLLGGNATLGSGTTTVFTGATLDFNNRAFVGSYTLAGGNAVNITSGSTTVVISGTSTISGASTAADFQVTSTGSAGFDLALTSTSAVTVDLGGRATFNQSVAGLVDAHGTTTFAGSLLALANVQVGEAGQSGAVAAFTGDTAAGSSVTVNGGALATFSGTVAGSVTTSGTVDLTGRVTSSGGLAVSSGGVGRLRDGAVYDATDIENAGTLIVNRTANLTLGAAVDGVGSLVKQGAATLTLTGSSSFSGGTTISAGTVALAGAGTLGGQGPVSLSAAAALDISGASGSRTIGALSGTAGSAILLGGNVLTAGGATNTAFAGVISGSGGFTKSGAGTLSLTSIQMFTGTTTVGQGVLALYPGGSIAASSFVKVAGGAVLDASGIGGLLVSSSQTLGGSGTVAGGFTIANGATLSPGNSPGTLSASGPTTWGGAGNYNWQIHTTAGGFGTSTGWDFLDSTGSLDITATGGNPFNVNLWSLAGVGPDVNGVVSDFNPSFNYNFLIAEFDGGITGFDATKFSLNTGAVNGTGGFQNSIDGQGAFSVARGDAVSGGNANQIYIVYAAVPEPGGFVLAGVGLAAASWSLRQRRRRRAAST